MVSYFLEDRKISIIEKAMLENKYEKFMFTLKLTYFVVYPSNGHCLGKVEK